MQLTVTPSAPSAHLPDILMVFLVHMGLIHLHLMSYGALVSAWTYYEKQYSQSAELKALAASGLVAFN